MSDLVQKLKDYQYSQNDVFITSSEFKGLKLLDSGDANEEITLYRGINCLTKEIRDNVLGAIHENRFTQGSLIASFSSDKDIATEFSFSEMSNFPTPEITRAQELREDRLDYMTGYSGLIVEATYKRSDVLDVGAIIGSSEMEFLVPTSATPLSVSVSEVIPYHRQIEESDLSMYAHIQSALDSQDDGLLLHIAKAWSRELSAPSRELLVSGMGHLSGNDLNTLIACLPEDLRNSQVVLKNIHSPTVLNELRASHLIEPDAAKHRMEGIVKERMDSKDPGAEMLRFSRLDFSILSEMGAIDSKGMDKAISELLRKGDHDEAVHMVALYGYSNPKVVSALFKQEVTKHQQEISSYNASLNDKERISNNQVVISNKESRGYSRVTQTHTVDGGCNALFRYTSYHRDDGSEPESLGCSMIGNANMYKLMAQYRNFTKADQIRSDIILEDTLKAIHEIQSIPDAHFPTFNDSTISTLTRYPNAPHRSHIIDAFHSGKLSGVHKIFSMLNVMSDDPQIRNVMAKKLESNLSDIAKGMGRLEY